VLDNIDVIVFDLDNTLVRLEVDWAMVKSDLCEAFITSYNYRSSFSPLNAELEKLREKHGRAALDGAFSIIALHECEAAESPRRIPRMCNWLTELKEDGKKIAVFSDNTRPAVLLALKNAGLSPFIDLIMAKEDVIKWKPDSEGLKKISERFSIAPARMMMVGNDIDETTAKNFGIKFTKVI